MAIKHALVSAKADGGDATLVQPSNWNDNHVIDSEVTFPAVSSPATPTVGNFSLFGKTLATRTMPAAIGPSGMDYVLQPAMFRQKIGIWSPPGNTTSVPGIFGLAAWAIATATATSRGVATTNLMTRMRRLGYVSTDTAGAVASIRSSAAQYSTGNGSGLGGFFMSFRFNFSDAAAVAGVRAFVGVSSDLTVPSNVEPNTLLNCVGIAQLSTDNTQLYLVYGGSAAQTAIPLGTNFPPFVGTVGVTTGVAYDLTLFAPPNTANTVHVRLERVGTSFVYDNTLSGSATVIPQNTTLIAPRLWRSNNATALAVAFDLANFYVETDY
jgi:hypothetical protein